MADGRSLLNLGTKKLQMAFQCGRIMTGTFSVVDISKPLLSMGKLVSMGKEEVSLVHCRQETAIRNLFARTIWVLIPKPQCIGTISQENHLRQKRLKRPRTEEISVINQMQVWEVLGRATVKRKGYSYTLGRREQGRREEREVSFPFGCKGDQAFQRNTRFMDGFL